MRFRFEFTLGNFSAIYEPVELPDDDAEPDIQAISSADALVERVDDHFPPALHIGFRSGYYDE